jgi:hypothetical protein
MDSVIISWQAWFSLQELEALEKSNSFLKERKYIRERFRSVSRNYICQITQDTRIYIGNYRRTDGERNMAEIFHVKRDNLDGKNDTTLPCSSIAGSCRDLQ